MRKFLSLTSFLLLFLLSGAGSFAPALSRGDGVAGVMLSPPQQEPACATICSKVGVNTAYPVRRPVEEYLRAQRLGMGWILEIAYHPVDMGRTVEAINRAHDHGLKPIIRVCAGSVCPFSDPAVYSQFLHEVASRVSGEFWALMGPNEPELEPWAGDPVGVARYMNTMLDLTADIPNLRRVSPAFNATNGITDSYFRRMEGAGARFSELDAFAATTYTVAGNGAYYYYAYNTGHAETLRRKALRYGKQVIFVEYGTFGMFDKPGQNNPARWSIIAQQRTQVVLAASDPTVMAILYFDAFGANGSPHMYYDPEMIALSRDMACVGASQSQAGIGIYTWDTTWQLAGESACRKIAYGCPYQGGAATVCTGSLCIDNDADGFYGDGGSCTRTDCDDGDPAIGASCGGNQPDRPASWGTLRTIDARVADGDTFLWPNIAIRHNGLPIVAYHDGRIGRYDLVALDCTTPDCSRALRRVLVSENDSGQYVSMAIRQDGRPLIAHFDWTDEDFEVFDCGDANCASGVGRIVDYTTGYYGFDTSMAIRQDGRPIIAYWHSNEQDLRLYNCADVNCLAGAIQTLVSYKRVGYDPSIIVGLDGNPLIANVILDYGHLRLHVCRDPDCSSGSFFNVLDWENAEGFPTSGMALRRSGLPVLAYRDTFTGALMFIDCHTPDCADYTQRVLDPESNYLYGSIAVLLDDSPFIAYTEFASGEGHNLRLLRCFDPSCHEMATEVLTDGDLGKTPHIAIRPNGNPLVVFHDVGNGDLMLYDVDLSLVPGPLPTQTPPPITPTPSQTPTPTPTTSAPTPTPDTPMPTTPTPIQTPDIPTSTPPAANETPTSQPAGSAACFSFRWERFYEYEQAKWRLVNTCDFPVTIAGVRIVWTEWVEGVVLDWVLLAGVEIWGAQEGMPPDLADGPYPQPSITDSMGEDRWGWRGVEITLQPGEVGLMRVDFDLPIGSAEPLDQVTGAAPSDFNGTLLYFSDGTRLEMAPE